MSEVQVKRLAVVGIIVASVLAVGGGYAFFCMQTGWGIPSLLHLLTGLDCGFCGLTRAAMAVLEGDLAASLSYHILWPLYAAYVLWAVIASAVTYVLRGIVKLSTKSLWIHLVFWCVTVVYGILRNLL